MLFPPPCKICASRAPSKGMIRTKEIFPASFFLTFLLVAFLLAASSTRALAQAGPEEDGNEVQVWAGGGHSVPGGTSDTEAVDAGLRPDAVEAGPHVGCSGPFDCARKPLCPARRGPTVRRETGKES